MQTPLIQYQIDAFSSRPFGGNPAAVILTPAMLDAVLMQSLAAENNLSETAFLTPRETPGHYNLRWFTPATEIEFCGHATLASAHALFEDFKAQAQDSRFHFHTQIGALSVSRDGADYVLRAPVSHAVTVPVTPAIRAAFPVAIEAAFTAGDNLYVVFETAADIETLTPDFAAVARLSNHGVGVTSAGDRAPHDCVSRFFVPAQGIDEDPVTGSAHAAIGPYWAQRLGKRNLTAYQASKRGGTLRLSIGDDSIDIAGPAVTVMKSEIYL